jgi:hypothetical protein
MLAEMDVEALIGDALNAAPVRAAIARVRPHREITCRRDDIPTHKGHHAVVEIHTPKWVDDRPW